MPSATKNYISTTKNFKERKKVFFKRKILFGFIKGKLVQAQIDLRAHGIFYGGRSNTPLWGDVDDVLYEIL